MNRTTLTAGVVGFSIFSGSALADVSETRELDNFTRIDLDGMMEVDVQVGEEPGIRVTVSKEKYLRSIETRVHNGTLSVKMDDMDEGFFSFFRNVEVSLYITVPSLEYVQLDGMGDLDISDVDAEDFELILDGMGSISVDGRCTSARMVLDGMGDLNARNLQCQRVRLVLDGMGDAAIYASEGVDVTLDGFGDVTVYGDPEDRRVNEEGLGSVDFD